MCHVLILNDMTGEHYGCDAVIARLISGLCSVGFVRVSTIPGLRSWQDPAFTSKLDDADFVIVNGEGTLHHNATRALQLLDVVDYCKARSIPCALVNTVYQSMDPGLSSKLANFNFISCRETFSKDEMSQQGISASVVPDLSISYFASKYAHLQSPRHDNDAFTLFTDSVLRDVTTKLYSLSQQIPNALFLTLCSHLEFKKRRLKNTFLELLLRKKKNNCVYISAARRSYCRNEKDLMTIVATAKKVITGRFHMVCMSISLLRPFLAIDSNTWKIRGLTRDAGLDACLSDFDAINLACMELEENYLYRNMVLYRGFAIDSSEKLFVELRRVYEEYRLRSAVESRKAKVAVNNTERP